MRVIEKESTTNKLVFATLLAIILFISIWQRWQFLNAFIWNPDEGIHLMVGRLVAAGYEPYSEVFYSYLPLFLETIRLPLQWFGSVTAVRIVMLGFAALEIAAVALIGRELDGNLAGLGAAIFLSLTSSFFIVSQSVLADIPAVALGLWASWAALRYTQNGNRSWLAASGVLLALSFLLKLLTVYVIAWVLLLIFQYHSGSSGVGQRWQKRAKLMGKDAYLFGISVAGPLLGMLIWYNLPAIIPSAFQMRLAMRSAFEGSFTRNVSLLLNFWQDNIPLILLAGYGLIRQYRRPVLFWRMLLWLGLIVLMLLAQTPLHPQHLQLLPPVLALLTGFGIADLMRNLGQHRPGGLSLQWVWLGLGLLLLIGYALSIFTLPQDLLDTERLQRRRAGQSEMFQFIQLSTQPNDCIIIDDLSQAVMMDRNVPPIQAELSIARVRSGYLTEADFLQAVDEAQCQIVVFSAKKRFDALFPGFRQWVAKHYRYHAKYGHQEMYFIRRDVRPPTPGDLLANFEGKIQLVAADWRIDNWQPGQVMPISFYWRAETPLQKDYKIFLHLRSSGNQNVAQLDHQPYGGILPTTAWQSGETLKETVWLKLPTDDFEPGQYRLLVGLYDPDTLERLRPMNDTSGENAVVLGQLLIQ